ncbi:Fe2+-enterobactin ABC transporter substrate-binding protein [Rhodococcus sp. NPDC058521]|uniref:Fe2+-enterobactin ABC transporter substrate-binding protein n=1 Tax=Rhodococcus sp. NPDC058521 TaxID=3346536 RepID=UPI0036689C1C
MKLRRSMAVAAILAVGIASAACSSDTESLSESSSTVGADSASEGNWPRTITDETGSVTIDKKPERIVSTSVTLTGSLLALDAPIIGTGTQAPSSVTDKDGRFSQWADVADEKGVETLYQGAPNVERITAAEPDLIFVSAGGADTAREQVDILKQIAPVVLLRYDDKSWQDLSIQIAGIIGAEEQAQEIISEFDTRIDEAKTELGDKISAANPVNVLTYNSPEDSRIFTPVSAQGMLLTRLGFSLAELPTVITDADAGDFAGRKDVYPATQENLPLALPGNTTMIVSATEPDAERFVADPLLRDTPSVQQDQVFALGEESFRLDYYSAKLLVDNIVEELDNQ